MAEIKNISINAFILVKNIFEYYKKKKKQYQFTFKGFLMHECILFNAFLGHTNLDLNQTLIILSCQNLN